MKKMKPAFDFEAEGLDEVEFDKILTIRRCDGCVIKLPQLECEIKSNADLENKLEKISILGSLVNAH